MHNLAKKVEPCHSWGGRGGGASGSGGRESPADSLRAAAKLVETVAFEEASGLPTDVVVELILVAARLERLAGLLEAEGPAEA